MKKIILALSLLVLVGQVAGAEQNSAQQANVNSKQEGVYTRPAFETRQTNYSKNSAVYKKESGNEYLLKYNIDDLESAPWLNGGKRKI